MSLFALLDFEPEIQINDKIRLNASKSFFAKNSSEIISCAIKPDLSTNEIECYNPNQNEWFLDWVYTDTTIDVGSQNYNLIFNEGSSDISVNLTADNYSLSDYATEIASKMTSSGSQIYTASVSDNKITISAPAQFKFKNSQVAIQSFFELDVFNTSHTSDYVEYGNKIVTVTVDNGTVTDTKYFYLKCYSVAGDYLFSDDGDLMAHEPDIMKWVNDGRSSFKNVHRRAQKLILAWLDEKGYVNTFGEKYTKFDIVDVEEVKQWSTFMVLRLIFQGLSNSIDDVFDRKSQVYSQLEEAARQRVILRIDTDEDGIADSSEGVSIYSGSLYRR